MTESHILTTAGLTLTYGDRTIVEDLDLVIPPGFERQLGDTAVANATLSTSPAASRSEA